VISMPLTKNQKIVREEILGKLRKWIRGIKDDIIGEEGAIKMYSEHILEFGSDMKFNVSKDSLIKALKYLGMNEETIQIIADELWDMIYRSEEHKSLLSIKTDEEGHKQELSDMVLTLKSIVGKILRVGKR